MSKKTEGLRDALAEIALVCAIIGFVMLAAITIITLP